MSRLPAGSRTDVSLGADLRWLKASERSEGQILTTNVGLRLPPQLTYEQWAAAGPRLVRIASSVAWCVGDWLAYGQDRYESRYAETVEQIGLDYQTLRNYAWVARKFDISRRRPTLSFQHHAEVASLSPDEQDTWLDRADQHCWSRNELRRQLRQALTEGRRGGPDVSVLPRLSVEQARLQAWRQAAEQQQVELTLWIVTRLDQAASRELNGNME